MKKVVFVLMLILVFFTSCDNEEQETLKGSVQFSFSDSERVTSKSVNLSEKSRAFVPTDVVIGIEDKDGNTEEKKLSINTFNDYYITSPISLLVGDYEINKFLIYSGDTVILASPYENSKLAYLVDDPLNINFTILKDEVKKVVPEVLSTSGFDPDDFGYATFSYNEVDIFSFLAAAFVWNEDLNNYSLVDAELEITNIEGTILYNDTLDSKTNIIPVRGEYDTYIISCSKIGYATYCDTLTLEEMKDYISDPLEIILEEKETGGTSKNLIAYYPFNGNANDESGNNNDGVVYNDNASLTTGRKGNSNSAYLFTGNDDHFGNSSSQYIIIPNIVNGLSQLTLSVWFEFHSYEEYRHHWDGIISYGLNNTGMNTGIIYNDENKKIYFSIRVEENSYYRCTIDYDESWTNVYKHYALTFNGESGELVCYVDGEEVASKTECYGEIESPDTVAAIGGHYWADVFSARLNGKVDDIKVYNKALSSDEVNSLYNE